MRKGRCSDMGSRGTKYWALEEEKSRNYKTAGYVLDAEVLIGKEKSFHSLPEVSRKADAIYRKLNPDGTFRERRVFQNHRLRIEIAYHQERELSGDYVLILHAHDINGKEFKEHPKARHLTEEEFVRYSPYFIGLNLERIKR